MSSLRKMADYPVAMMMTSYRVAMLILYITRIGSILFRNDSRR